MMPVSHERFSLWNENHMRQVPLRGVCHTPGNSAAHTFLGVVKYQLNSPCLVHPISNPDPLKAGFWSTFPGNKPIVTAWFALRGLLLSGFGSHKRAGKESPHFGEESPHLGVSMLSLTARGKHIQEQSPKQEPTLWGTLAPDLIVDWLHVTQKPQGYNQGGTDFSGMSRKAHSFFEKD